ncbi:uncharacterized protein [Leptinotarsa decemlineata]|uniref:uncharacterized protein n=1 Tax=Leptinotarsa decemlineata TaxID=7539 RepID=UPI003D305083
MSELAQTMFRDTKNSVAVKISLKSSKKSKWNELFVILLNLTEYSTWNAVILSTVILNYILVTINLTHAPRKTMDFIPFYAIFDILYLCNFTILLSHKVGNVAKIPMKTIFVLVLDGLSILPQIALFIPLFEVRYSFFVCYFRTTTFLRLHYLFLMRRKLEIFQQNRLCWILIQYFLTLMVFAHTTNFIWFFIECRSDNCSEQLYTYDSRKVYKDPTEWYFRHVYASVQVLLNVGFGGMLPKNFHEVLLFIFVIIVGQGLATWLVSSLSWYMMNRDYHKVFFIQKIADVKRYFEGIDDDIKTKTVNYYRTMYKHYEKTNHPSILAALPPSLKTDLIHDINCGLLYRSMLLKDLPEFVLRKISLAMKSVYLLPDEIIYSQCVVKTCMICVESGILEVLNDEDEESRVIAFTPGTIIGESALFLNTPSKATVRAVSYTELKILEKKDFLNNMMYFPEILKNLKLEIEKRMADAFKNKTAVKIFSPPNLKRLKVKLQKSVEKEVGTSGVAEYPSLYKIDKTTSFGIIPNRLPLLKSWSLIYAISQAIFCLLYSFSVVFKRTDIHHFQVYGILMDVLCIIDIVIQTTTCRVFHENIIISLKKTIDQRLDNWRYNLDIFSVFPMELWSNFFEHPVVRSRMYYIFKLNRVLRLHRINEIIQDFECEIRGRYCIGWILKILVYGLLFCYLVACIIHLYSCPYEICEDDSWYQLRMSKSNDSSHSAVTAVYFVMMSLSTGLGEFLSKTNNEIVLMISIILFAIFWKYYMLAKLISSLFLENFHKKQQKLRFFLKRFSIFYRMPPLGYRRLSEKFRIDPYFYEGTNKNFIEKTVPHYLLMLLQTSKIKNTLGEIPLFLMVDSYFLTFIEKHAGVLKLPINESLYPFGDLTRQMYVIQKGFCRIYNSEDCLERTVGPGTQLGVLEMFFCMPKKHTVVTCTDCVIISLEYTSIRQILGLFPKEYSTIEDIVHNENIMSLLKKIDTNEDAYENCDIGRHIIVDRKCFISLSKSWPNYCEVYRQKLGSLWFFAVLLMPVSIHPEGFFSHILVCHKKCFYCYFEYFGTYHGFGSIICRWVILVESGLSFIFVFRHLYSHACSIFR